MTPEALARLHAACFTQPPPWSAASFRNMLADPACHLETRASDGKLAGFALFRMAADEAELLTLATAPDARRQGHARALVHAGLAAMQSRGAGVCFLEVAADNAPAIRLYQMLGFDLQGRRKAYYRASGRVTQDALVFRARLA